ncbi:unnamed protein product (macronuclear) [Paramecium tetraurelia]|uniref:Uncharacterized protein n=1 Tax=Paramecium tetraurelia TaxID=5888 RepID=A0EBU9_PARTE|nr:uncharacterized protein GSPATT00025501001 [Paramecium tetraurelia]CAK92766.1 unnamed protein product [Paramecium tetraurelia]|eukprot:XP_001460163.1 hypothetical protein (macronuclear) [Paramecium tetraurelia strain d4-2]
MHEETNSFTSSVLSDNPMMSEQDAQLIVQSYNSTIQSLVKENDVLQKKLEEYVQNEKEEEQKLQQTKHQYETQITRMEQLKQQQLQIDQEREQIFTNSIFQQQKQLVPNAVNYLYEFLHQDQKQPSHTNIIHNQGMDTQNSLMQFDEDVSPRIEQNDPSLLKDLHKQKEELGNQKNQLISQILESLAKYAELQLQKCSKKECQQCHLLYNPRTNYIDSCLFHSGKLKFYSCKKCGADDYYTCCNKCIRCSEGCKTNFHQPKP